MSSSKKSALAKGKELAKIAMLNPALKPVKATLVKATPKVKAKPMKIPSGCHANPSKKPVKATLVKATPIEAIPIKTSSAYHDDDDDEEEDADDNEVWNIKFQITSVHSYIFCMVSSKTNHLSLTSAIIWRTMGRYWMLKESDLTRFPTTSVKMSN